MGDTRRPIAIREPPRQRAGEAHSHFSLLSWQCLSLQIGMQNKVTSRGRSFSCKSHVACHHAFSIFQFFTEGGKYECLPQASDQVTNAFKADRAVR